MQRCQRGMLALMPYFKQCIDLLGFGATTCPTCVVACMSLCANSLPLAHVCARRGRRLPEQLGAVVLGPARTV